MPQKSKTGCFKTFFIITGVGAVLAIGGCAVLTALVGRSSKGGTRGEHISASGEVFKIGDTVSFEDSKWEVLNARSLGTTLSGGEFTEPKKTSGRFVYVRFRVTNVGTREKSILRTPKLQDSQGRSFNQLESFSLAMYLPDGEEEMTLEQLPASVPKTFSAIYEVAQDSADLSFLTRPLGFGSTEKAVRLGF